MTHESAAYAALKQRRRKRGRPLVSHVSAGEAQIVKAPWHAARRESSSQRFGVVVAIRCVAE